MSSEPSERDTEARERDGANRLSRRSSRAGSGADRAAKLLADGAVAVLFRDGEGVLARCATPRRSYAVTHRAGDGWSCECRMKQPCPHVDAVRRVTVESSAAPTGEDAERIEALRPSERPLATSAPPAIVDDAAERPGASALEAELAREVARNGRLRHELTQQTIHARELEIELTRLRAQLRLAREAPAQAAATAPPRPGPAVASPPARRRPPPPRAASSGGWLDRAVPSFPARPRDAQR